MFGDKADTVTNKKRDKKGGKRKQKGDKGDTMTKKKGDKKGDKTRQKGDKRRQKGVAGTALGCRFRGRRSTQSLQEELRNARSPLGPQNK